MYRLILNTSFVDLNEYINAERMNRYKAASIKKEQTNKVHFLAIEQKFKLEPGSYDVRFLWHKPNNRKDHDNISFSKKFILDGLVSAGVLPGDSPRYIRNFKDEFFIDKTRDYVSCIVEFLKVD